MVQKVVAVVGCGHGELNLIYDRAHELEQSTGARIDLLIVCGDFQSVRNEMDLGCMSSPLKYRKINDFWEYYNGSRTAPYLTLFIGGNHEAWNYLQELYYGGWVAPNIYYVGSIGCVRWSGLRILGVSGIFKRNDYRTRLIEHAPFTESTVRSIYHIKRIEVEKMNLLPGPIDIVLSHDWPAGVAQYGDLSGLYRYKSYLREEIENNSLGCADFMSFLNKKQPSLWFAAHHHVRYTATVPNTPRPTQFHAFDKALPRRPFLELLTLDAPIDDNSLSYDIEWLAVLRKSHAFTSPHFRGVESLSMQSISSEDIEEVKSLFRSSPDDEFSPGSLRIPQQDPFVPTAPFYSGGAPWPASRVQRQGNPQTDALLARLRLPHLLTVPYHRVWREETILEDLLSRDPNERTGKREE